MPIEFRKDYDTSKMDGFDNPTAGQCHLEVVRVDEETTSKASGNSQMEVDFEVLAHTDENQVGKNHREFFTKSAAAEGRMLTFAVATGLTTKEELDKLQEQDKAPVIDFHMAEGRQLFGDLTEEEYQGKTNVKLNFKMYPVTSTKHKSYPRNQGKLNQLGDAQDDPFISGGAGAGDSAADNVAADDDLFG